MLFQTEPANVSHVWTLDDLRSMVHTVKEKDQFCLAMNWSRDKKDLSLARSAATKYYDQRKVRVKQCHDCKHLLCLNAASQGLSQTEGLLEGEGSWSVSDSKRIVRATRKNVGDCPRCKAYKQYVRAPQSRVPLPGKTTLSLQDEHPDALRTDNDKSPAPVDSQDGDGAKGSVDTVANELSGEAIVKETQECVAAQTSPTPLSKQHAQHHDHGYYSAETAETAERLEGASSQNENVATGPNGAIPSDNIVPENTATSTFAQSLVSSTVPESQSMGAQDLRSSLLRAWVGGVLIAELDQSIGEVCNETLLQKCAQVLRAEAEVVYDTSAFSECNLLPMGEVNRYGRQKMLSSCEPVRDTLAAAMALETMETLITNSKVSAKHYCIVYHKSSRINVPPHPLLSYRFVNFLITLYGSRNANCFARNY
jgi:hypothetical protein